ncbi:MAG TPA: hypothetical protein VGG44_06500 [Tepidisphaeraceae bacterium]|jgi:hypothetical protein
MSTATPPSVPPIGISYQPRPLPAEKPPLLQRINWRVLVFVAVILLPIALLFLWWLNETLSGGIHNHGAYAEIDLKAMSSFDMDQMNATMEDIPEKWRALEGKKVVMVGEMWAPNYAGDSARLNYFQLVYSKTKCCFSGPPLAQHFVDGNVVKGSHVYYYDVPVRVLGTEHVYVRKDPATGVIKSIYHVDVEKVTPIE